MTVMTENISDSARARREAARDRGRFGEQPHTAPEIALKADSAADARMKTVDDLLASYFSGQSTDEIGVDEVRTLMLDAISAHQSANPAVVVIDGDGRSSEAPGVEVISLDYLGEYYDDGDSPEMHVQRATEDLERLRAAGLDASSAGWQLREHISNNLATDSGWEMASQAPILGGRYGEYVIEEFHGTTEVKLRDAATGAVVSTYPDYAAARAVAHESDAA
jgi:hypothetical protein